MPNDVGVASWSPPFLLDHPWLDGAYLAVGPSTIEKIPDAPPIVVMQTLAGTTIVQGQLVGTKAPSTIERHSWRLDLSPVVDLADYRAMERARAKARPVDFAIGNRVIDVFPAILDTLGERTLSRRVATGGEVTGVSEATHPTIVYLDGVEDPAAADVLGQTVTINAEGEVMVEYTPLYRVLILTLPWAIPVHNKLDVTFSVQEITEGDMG